MLIGLLLGFYEITYAYYLFTFMILVDSRKRPKLIELNQQEIQKTTLFPLFLSVFSANASSTGHIEKAWCQSRAVGTSDGKELEEGNALSGPFPL